MDINGNAAKTLTNDFVLDSQQPRLLRSHKVEFTGTGGEYFRIWIVNTCLTILTLGIYLAWAKVRKRRYFYSNTLIGGHPFSYTAKPSAIFKGYLVIAICVVLINVTNVINPSTSFIGSLIFGLLFPFLLYKSLRFRARNTVFRNIPFRFWGSLKESYILYLACPILIPLSLGLYFPYWQYLQKKYFFGNMGYGSEKTDFRAKVGPFYLYFLIGGLVFGLLIAACTAAVFPLIFTQVTEIASQVPPEQQAKVQQGLAVMTTMATMLIVFALGAFLKTYLFAKITNHCLQSTTIGRVQFFCTLKAPRLLWIQFTNLLAVLFSAGLLMPWAQVRRHRYIVENISVVSDTTLEEFATGASQDEDSAVGDAATEFFDIEIGL